jgi:hypothetical protein
MVFQTVSDDSSMARNSIVVNVNDLYELLKSNISHVIFLVSQKSTENIDSEYT